MRDFKEHEVLQLYGQVLILKLNSKFKGVHPNGLLYNLHLLLYMCQMLHAFKIFKDRREESLQRERRKKWQGRKEDEKTLCSVLPRG